MVEDVNSGDPMRADRAARWLMAGPQIEDHNAFSWRGFQDLRSERPWTMDGPRSIPFTAAKEYGQYYGLTGRALDRFVNVIKLVDHHELGIFADARAKQAKKTK